MSEPPHIVTARKTITTTTIELERMIDGLRAGVDPELIAKQTRSVQAEKASAEALVRAWESSSESIPPLTRDVIEAALAHAGGLAPILATADRETKAALYRNLDIDLTYNELDGDQSVTVQYQLDGGGGRI